MSAGTGDLISRIYGGFRGVDFRGEEINLSRSPDAVNMWKDYRETESIRTRPALKLVADFLPSDATVHSMYIHKLSRGSNAARMYVHYDSNALYVDIDDSGRFGTVHYFSEPVVNFANDGESHFFTFNDKVYLIASGQYFWHSQDVVELQKVEPYVPTTTIGKKPAGGGTLHEDVNMLTPWRINTFLADGKSTEYFVDGALRSIDYVKVNGNVLRKSVDYTYSSDRVIFYEHSIPSVPATDGQDNVEIKFQSSSDGKWGNSANVILTAKRLTIFDNRVFVGGCSQCPNVLFHSSLNDPTYFSDQDYYEEGKDNAPIRGLVAGNNALWVFRHGASDNSNVFYHTPTIDEEYGKVYPSTHSNIGVGCAGRAINFNDDIVFFSDNGMEGVSGDITTEQAIAHRSSLVDRKMLFYWRQIQAFYDDMILMEWEGYLIAFIGTEAYLADSRAAFTNVDHMEYEWYYWKMPHYVTAAQVFGGVAYIMLDDRRIYTLDISYAATKDELKEAREIQSHWVTPKDKFNAPHLLKTTNKRGCVVEATGDITVSAKVDGGAFEPIGTYEKVTDYFVSRIKRKKFKDIQLKFSSDTRFSLETATLESFIGGYIKR